MSNKDYEQPKHCHNAFARKKFASKRKLLLHDDAQGPNKSHVLYTLKKTHTETLLSSTLYNMTETFGSDTVSYNKLAVSQLLRS